LTGTEKVANLNAAWADVLVQRELENRHLGVSYSRQ